MEKNISLIKKCDACESDATCLCFICSNYYCEKCYKYIHNLKKYNNHKKEQIDSFVPFDLKCPDHPANQIELFCLEDKELCCCRCYFKNYHSGHKLIEITDEEYFKKENITLDLFKNKSNEIYEKTINLKNKIENEIKKLDELYNKVIDNLNKSYKNKYEKLKKEENELK